MDSETVLILVRAVVMIAGAEAARRGWTTAAHAKSWSGEPAIWIAGAICAIGPTLLGSWWGRKRQAALKYLATLAPAGTTPAIVESMLRQIGRRSILQLAHKYHAEVQDGETAHLEKAIAAVHDTLANHGFGDPATIGYLVPDTPPAEAAPRPAARKVYDPQAFIAELARQYGVKDSATEPAVVDAIAPVQEPYGQGLCAAAIPSPGSPSGFRVCGLPWAAMVHVAAVPLAHTFVGSASGSGTPLFISASASGSPSARAG